MQMHIFYFYLPKSYSSECYNYVFLGESLISSFGKRDNPQSLAQGQKLITTLSRVLLNVAGFDNFLVSFTSIYPTLLWCTATTYQLSISLRTLSSLSLLYKTYWIRYSFRARKSCSLLALCCTCADLSTICWRHNKTLADCNVWSFLIQYVYHQQHSDCRGAGNLK
jgi:hypothetical protein